MNTFFRMRLSEQDREVKNFLKKKGYNLSTVFRNLMYELYDRETKISKIIKTA